MEILDPVTREALTLPTRQASDARTDLGQNEFLKLMTTQLRNQDPFQPLENGEFLSQMAQFSTVAGIEEMNQAVSTLADSIRAGQALQAAAIVGREVLVEGDRGVLRDGNGIAGAVDVPVGSNGRVSVRVLDGAGRLVRELSLGQQRDGLANFNWDGMSDDGERAPAGEYRFVAQVERAGESYGLTTLVASLVTGVSLLPGSGGAELTTELGDNFNLSSVRSIR